MNSAFMVVAWRTSDSAYPIVEAMETLGRTLSIGPAVSSRIFDYLRLDSELFRIFH